jgi:chromosome segregation ATPase
MDTEMMKELLSEVQNELRSVRSSLFQERRVSEDRRKLIEELQDKLVTANKEMEEKKRQLQQMADEVTSVNARAFQLQELEAALQSAMHENRRVVEARKVLEEELRDVREALAQAERRAAMSDSERARLQQSQSEAAAQLRLAHRRAMEAENEQMNAEEEASVLRSELDALKAALLTSSTPPNPEPLGMSTPSSKHSSMGGALSPLSASQLQHLLEGERSRAAMLLQNLQSSRLEADSLREELETQMSVAKEARAAMERYEHSVSRQREEEEELRRRAKEGDRRLQVLSEVQAELDVTRSDLAAAKKALALKPPPAPSSSSSAHEALVTSGKEGLSGGGLTPSSTARSKHNSSSNELVAMLEEAKRLESSSISEEDHHTLVAELEALVNQVFKLKQSRDKLLEQIDAQWQEMDRISSDHEMTIVELQEARKASASWEQQCQDALAQCERLKGLLEEGLTWNEGQEGEGATPSAVGKLLKLLNEERVRSQELELGARALAAELVRAQGASLDIGRTMLPVLSGVEGRLEGMVERARRVVSLVRSEQERIPLAIQGA